LNIRIKYNNINFDYYEPALTKNNRKFFEQRRSRMGINQLKGVFRLFLLLSILALLVGCGGGGGGGDDVDTGGGGLNASSYNFALDLDETGGAPFQIDIAPGSIPFVGIPGSKLGSDFNGAMDLAEENGEIVISSIAVVDTTAFYIDVSDLWDGMLLKITVVDPIVFEDGDDPSSGSFKMENGTDDPTTISFSKNGDAFMVNISGVADPIGLDDFKDSLEMNVDALRKQASVAYHAIELLYDQVILVASMIIKIENDDLGTEHGDSNAGLPDPTGGTLTLSCTSGSVEPGANFSLAFDNFWQDAPDDNIDTLIEGSVNFMGFFKTETNEVLENIGFEWGDGAGVFYNEDGVAFSETEDTGNSLTRELTHTVFGSYSIIFSLP
jgi:hypothetical protein